MNARKLSKTERQKIISLYLQGLSCVKIERDYGFKRTTVFRILKMENISMRSRVQFKKGVYVNCNNCGKEKRIKLCEIKFPHHFCNLKCYAKFFKFKGDKAAKQKLHQRIKTQVSKSLKHVGYNKAGQKWETLVGYAAKDLKKHLEKRWVNGMTWENYGNMGWHIDHIIPVSAFNFSSPDDIDFKKCWALKNLQPLWREENLKKWKHLKKPFQPSLGIRV